MKNAREEVVFNRKTPEERLQVIQTRQEQGVMKRTDTYHMQAIQIEEYMKDDALTCRLDMLARMFQAKMRVKDKRERATFIHYCLLKWQPRAHMFLAFKSYLNTVKYLQTWWRRTSRKLKDIRDQIAKRWEKIEKYGTSGFVVKDPTAVYVCQTEGYAMYDQAKRTLFLENELRARRFYGLSTIAIWEEDSAKWSAKEKARKSQGLKGDKEIQLAPLRPSYLPPSHLSTEGPHRACPEYCLGRAGDNEIIAMIRAARSNPKGGGWKQIPQKSAQGAKMGKSKKAGGAKADDSETTSAAHLFGEAAPEDLEHWGVHPSAMPRVGQKPEGNEAEGRYP